MENLKQFIEERKREFRESFESSINYGHEAPMDMKEFDDFLESALTELANEMKGLVPEEMERLDYDSDERGHNSCREETLKNMDAYILSQEKLTNKES